LVWTAAGWLLAPPLAAAERPERALSTPEIESWLDAPSGADGQADAEDDAADAPPPAPRHQGVTVESSLGALGHLGPLKNVTPVSPWFHLKVGFEPFRFLLVFAETDLIFSNTSYARRPPSPRTYRLYGFGAGLRFTLQPLERLGTYLEASLGGARVSEDVLSAYGYRDATELQPYFGARLGAEWYPVNPHLAVGVHGGARTYGQGLERERSTETALCWLGGVSLRYTF